MLRSHTTSPVDEASSRRVIKVERLLVQVNGAPCRGLHSSVPRTGGRSQTLVRPCGQLNWRASSATALPSRASSHPAQSRVAPSVVHVHWHSPRSVEIWMVWGSARMSGSPPMTSKPLNFENIAGGSKWHKGTRLRFFACVHPFSIRQGHGANHAGAYGVAPLFISLFGKETEFPIGGAHQPAAEGTQRISPPSKPMRS